jgi:2-C-methyl-D-erythritol 4-phosphate cytidylyltransferase
VPLAGKPLLLHTLQALQHVPAIGWIVVVVLPEDRASVSKLARRHSLTKISAVVAGAASRAESVARGVAALPPTARWVVIHDGARPCVTPQLISEVLLNATRHGAVACGLPAAQTVKAVDEDQQVRLTLDRSTLWLVQTPQAFRRDWLSDALARVNHTLDQFSDDAALLEWAGFPVRMIPGDPLNIKVTTKEDLLLAETILRVRGSRLKVQGQLPRTLNLEP